MNNPSRAARWLPIAALSLLLPAAVLAANPPPPPAPPGEAGAQPQGPGRHFASLDKDGDKRLSRAEAAGAPRMAEHFDAMDADKDGFLTREEMKAAHEQRREGRREEMRQHAEQRFTAADTNHDDQIDPAEAKVAMPKAAENFTQLDVDKNGKLSRDELRDGIREQMRQRHEGHRGPPPPDAPPSAK